ncbi:hypothetical protein D1007_15618 [Hordeum vulgare]|nr:hypothetical protein D1007_15618 [Hordeum vulgare]
MHLIVDTHVRGKDLSMVYMNEPDSVESSVKTMKQLLAEDKYQVVGFDLEFTNSHAGQDQKVLVAQLCVRHDILVYHYHLTTRPCECFPGFINNPDYNFAMVDTTNDLKALDLSCLTCKNLFNIHEQYKMKDESKKDKNAYHSAWDRRLDEEHVKYVAKDAYTSYNMYGRIIEMRMCLPPAIDEGS